MGFASVLSDGSTLILYSPGAISLKSTLSVGFATAFTATMLSFLAFNSLIFSGISTSLPIGSETDTLNAVGLRISMFVVVSSILYGLPMAKRYSHACVSPAAEVTLQLTWIALSVIPCFFSVSLSITISKAPAASVTVSYVVSGVKL